MTGAPPAVPGRLAAGVPGSGSPASPNPPRARQPLCPCGRPGLIRLLLRHRDLPSGAMTGGPGGGNQDAELERLRRPYPQWQI